MELQCSETRPRILRGTMEQCKQPEHADIDWCVYLSDQGREIYSTEENDVIAIMRLKKLT